MGDSVEVVRRKLLTATKAPLTRDEQLIGTLCEKIIQQNAIAVAPPTQDSNEETK